MVSCLVKVNRHADTEYCMPDEARDGRNVALIDKCFLVCSIVQRRIKLLHTFMYMHVYVITIYYAA